ncbi:MAG: hypothetical protein U9Q07_05050 [Planctomycetota bacterium]|nr:hypothetical protein [Planctomycetota bacterium]
MNQKDAQKAKRERCIFREFAKVCPLEINEESIKSGDDKKREPDILCQLKDGSGLAFELIEAVDEKITDKTGSVRKKAEEFWEEYKNNKLPKTERERFECVFSGCSFTLSLSDQATNSTAKKAIREIFKKYKNSCRSDLGLIKREGSDLPNGCESILIEPQDEKPPIFRCSTGSLISSACITALEKKFVKTYNKAVRTIHLLVYSDRHPLFLAKSDIETYVKQNIDSSPFDKIWFFERRPGKHDGGPTVHEFSKTNN